MSRVKWKGPYIDQTDFKTLKKNYSKTFLLVTRNSEIVPKYLGLTVKVHNGKKYNEIVINENMIGYKFGMFSFTRAQFSFKKKLKK